ncbi:MAG: hypothetical protein CBD21_04265 [bacterium TMED161]|nr:MAG: hypothetical protein CBD21_04265 [bacterium TMED161]
MSKKIYYLSSEVDPFSNTYSLSEFSQKACSRLHDIEDFDIRLNQPKYGYISERKYILREVIRLRDMLIEFDSGEDSVNLKSAFIPNSRVQIYFTESEKHFKPLMELLYKSKNGRFYKDNDLKFSFFCKVALETIKRLFWQPDIIVCNDWQMSMLPILLKKIYKNDEYYKNIKTVFFLHSIDENRVYSSESYKYVGLDEGSSEIDNLEQAILHSDYLVIVDDEKKNLSKQFKKHKNLFNAHKKTKTMYLTVPEKSKWSDVSKKIETLLRKI